MSESATHIIEKIQETLRQTPTCRIGLAGGTSPRFLYAELAKQKLPWNRIEFILLDERYVSPMDEQSNFRMLNETLFSNITVQPENIYVFNTMLPLEEAVKKSQIKLQDLARSRHPLFDIVILGMGKDGHIASLFPYSPALESKALVTSSETNQFPVRQRLTVTFEALLDSSEMILLAPDEEKKKIIQKAQQPNADFHELPVAKILQNKAVKIF